MQGVALEGSVFLIQVEDASARVTLMEKLENEGADVVATEDADGSSQALNTFSITAAIVSPGPIKQELLSRLKSKCVPVMVMSLAAVLSKSVVEDVAQALRALA